MASIDINDDELPYLQPNFDPSSLKVAQLRNVLLTHGISYQSGAKKADLVDVFNTSLKPKAKKILSDLRRIKRSSTGIEDAASSIASTQEDDEPAVTPAPSTRARGRPKKTRPTSTDDDQDETIVAPPTSRRRTPAPAKTPKAPSTARARSRTSRQTSAAPAVKQEDSVPETWKVFGGESPFSAENPFQSGGSSPPTAPATARRRKTDGPEDGDKRRKSVNRRRTDTPSTTAVTRKATVNVPLGGADDAIYNNEEVEAGEEFEPEEQFALEKARREGKAALVPVRRQARRQPGVSPLGQFLVTFLLVSATSFGALWRQEKFNVGYCDIGQPSEKVAGVEIPEWADTLRPKCEDCPRHARCFPNLETVCEDSFVLKHHPLSVNGLLPLPPSCEPDSEKEKRTKAVSNVMVDQLRTAAAKSECEKTTTGEVSEAALKAHVKSRVKKGYPPEEVEALFNSALEDTRARDEVVETVDATTGERRFRSKSLAKVGLSCALRGYFRRTLEQYTRQVLILLAVLCVAMIPVINVRDHLATRQEAKQIASQVFQNLAEDAAALAYDSSADRDGYLSVHQLRDDVLRNEFSASKRKKVWKHVEKLVEQNSNVRAKVGALDTGDVGRGWKWIGAVKSLEDGGSGSRTTSSRRQSSRYSLPAAADSSPQMAELHANGSPRVKKEDSFTRWENTGRPQF